MPASDLMHDGNEDTSQLDRLYDMLSGISEDSVRIYTGILDDEAPREARLSESAEEELEDAALPDSDDASEASPPVAEDAEPAQEPLVDAGEEPQKPRPRRRRAKIPTWDEIMFGGPTPS